MIEGWFQALVAALAGTALLWLVANTWWASRARAARRAAFLDEAAGLLGEPLKAIKPDGFPRLSGRYRGHVFDIQVVSDTLNIRKLPTLWLLVSLPEPLAAAGTFDLMMRPRGVEIFSRHSDLPVQIAPDAMFPHDCSIRTDAPLALPDRALLARHLGLFEDPRAKELVIAPKGLRVVWLAEEAHRGKYLLFRDSEMGLTRFPAAGLAPLLDYLVDLRADYVATTQRTDEP